MTGGVYLCKAVTVGTSARARGQGKKLGKASQVGSVVSVRFRSGKPADRIGAGSLHDRCRPVRLV